MPRRKYDGREALCLTLKVSVHAVGLRLKRFATWLIILVAPVFGCRLAAAAAVPACAAGWPRVMSASGLVLVWHPPKTDSYVRFSELDAPVADVRCTATGRVLVIIPPAPEQAADFTSVDLIDPRQNRLVFQIDVVDLALSPDRRLLAYAPWFGDHFSESALNGREYRIVNLDQRLPKMPVPALTQTDLYPVRTVIDDHSAMRTQDDEDENFTRLADLPAPYPAMIWLTSRRVAFLTGYIDAYPNGDRQGPGVRRVIVDLRIVADGSVALTTRTQAGTGCASALPPVGDDRLLGALKQCWRSVGP